MENSIDVPQKQKTKKTKDRAIMYPAIPLLGIHPEKKKMI